MEGKQIEWKIYPVTAMEYQLLEEIGHGTSAIVYSAVCLPHKEVVAIKALDLEKCKEDLDAVRREAVTMTLINHPNVVKAFCSFVVEEKLWVVMPYMAGGSCFHIMKSAFPNGFKEHVIATFLKEALKALEYLHGHGYIHRDVKAGNILVDGNGVVKLADFGVSAFLFETGDRQRSRNTFVGTPCWMAPEVLEQMHGYDSSADIWSFGITAMELAHGHAPFSSFPPAKIIVMTIKDAPPRLDQDGDKSRFSKSFKEMIAACLVKDPTKRPTAEKLLKHSFFKQAQKMDYIRQRVLDGLPALGEQYKKLKNMDMARHAQQNINFDKKNEGSQIEYERGISNWIFNIDDLKAEAALILDDALHQTVKEADVALHETIKEGEEALHETIKEGGDTLHETIKEGEEALQQTIKEGGDTLHETIKEGDETLHQDEFEKSTLYIHTKERVDFGSPNGIQLPTTIVQGLTVETKNQQLHSQETSSSLDLNGASIPAVAIVPHLKDALEYAIMQKDALENILRSINPNGVPISIALHFGSKQNSSNNALNDSSSMVEIQSESERAYLLQIEELQGKFFKLQEGVHILKERNIILERQLNAIYNKKEEEMMQREEVTIE